MPEKAPWPDSTPEEDAAYALQAQMWDMEFEGEVVSQGGPQLQGVVEAERSRLLPVGNYNLQGMYRGPEAESIMEIGRYGPIADKLKEQGLEAPGPDTVAAVGASNANPQIWAHEFGHRRDTQRGGGSERYRLIHDAFRSDTPFEWAAAVNRWYALNRRRWASDESMNSYQDVERDLKENIARSRNSLLNTEVEAREAEGDVPIKREGIFTIESLRKDQEEQMERRSKSWSIEKYNELIQNIDEQGKASGGKVVMPSKSPAQARLMRAAAHGWKKPGGGGPSPAVAREFVAADQAVGMYEGGLAPMVDLIQRGNAPGLNFQEGGEVLGKTFKQMIKEAGGSMGNRIGMMLKISKGIEDGTYFKDEATGLIYPAQQTILQPSGEEEAPPVAMAQGPRSGGPRGRRGRGGGGGGRGGGGGTIPDESCPSGFRRIRPNGQPGACTADPGDRIIPPTVPPGGIPPGGTPPGGTPPGPFIPPDRRTGRDTEYSAALRAHKARVAASLQVPPGGFAEGGEVRPGHAEGVNPYPEGSARYNLWERQNHKEPPPPPPPPPPPEEPGFLAKWLGLGVEEDRQSRSERELEELEKNEAYGGYVDGYANGGLAQANFRRAPRGGVPPQVGGMMKPRMGGVPPRLDPRAMPPQPYGGGATTGQSSLPPHLRNRPPGMRDPMQNLPMGMKDPRQRIAPPPGKYPRFPGGGRGGFPGGRDPRSMPPQGGGRSGMMGRLMQQAQGQRGRMDPRGIPVPRGMPPDAGGPGPRGGPQMPPNLRGQLQQMRMMNRPRRGVPGPAGAGGQPNRVGMQDQQGGLARALQRGTGRPPMSRRSGSFR